MCTFAPRNLKQRDLKTKALLLSLMIAANGFAQSVIDVHSHLITPEFVSTLENEGRLGLSFKKQR